MHISTVMSHFSSCVLVFSCSDRCCCHCNYANYVIHNGCTICPFFGARFQGLKTSSQKTTSKEVKTTPAVWSRRLCNVPDITFGWVESFCKETSKLPKKIQTKGWNFYYWWLHRLGESGGAEGEKWVYNSRDMLPLNEDFNIEEKRATPSTEGAYLMIF